jgi:hypothetical protein
MKKLFLVGALALFGAMNAQTAKSSNGATAKGKWVVEANTNFGAAHTSQTSIGFVSRDGYSRFSLGGEVGYFVANNLAIKAGLGFGSEKYEGDDASSNFSYKLGAKYYVDSKFPLQIDLNGASVKDANENPLYLGLQGGYAWFVAPNVSIEPGLRYDLSLNKDYDDKGFFSGNVGFAFHF